MPRRSPVANRSNSRYRMSRGTPGPLPPPLDPEALALEARYRAAGADGLADAKLTSNERAALFALREAGRVTRVGPTGSGVHAHVDFAA